SNVVNGVATLAYAFANLSAPTFAISAVYNQPDTTSGAYQTNVASNILLETVVNNPTTTTLAATVATPTTTGSITSTSGSPIVISTGSTTGLATGDTVTITG